MLVAILALLIIALAGVPIFLVVTIQKSTERALAPIEAANQTLKTQVSQILNPTPTIIPDPVTVIEEVKSLARLETIQYSVEKVITAETGQGQFAFLFGDRLLFVAHGTVIAGIDMSLIQPQDLKMVDGHLHVRLPEPQIFVATLDNDQSYVYDRQQGLLKKDTLDLETKARQVAVNEIENAALQVGILRQAKQNAEVYLTHFFDSLGYPRATFEYYPAPTPIVTPVD
jgi:hypothetical protein